MHDQDLHHHHHIIDNIHHNDYKTQIDELKVRLFFLSSYKMDLKKFFAPFTIVRKFHEETMALWPSDILNFPCHIPMGNRFEYNFYSKSRKCSQFPACRLL